MAGKKKLSRQERKKQQQQKKNRVRRRTGWQEPERPEINLQLLDDLRPFLARPDMEKGMLTLMELAAESDELVAEPEFISLFFPLGDALHLFADTLEKEGIEAEDYVALPEEERDEKFYEVIEKILPTLLTDEFRKEFLAHAEAARTRFREAGAEQKLWQASAAQFTMEMKTDREQFFSGLLYAIAMKSIEAGSLLSVSNGEDSTSIDEEELSQQINEFPGLHTYLEGIIQEVRTKFLNDLIEGEILLHLYTDAEIEAVAELMETQDEADNLKMLGGYLDQILTEQRQQELGERLAVLMADLPEYLERTWPILEDLQDDLPEVQSHTASWALLVAALVGEVNAYEPD